MSTQPSECAGSWRPMPHMEPGDGIVCDHCKRQVSLRPPPVDLTAGPWPGATHARIEPHPAVAPPRKDAVETPWSEG